MEDGGMQSCGLDHATISGTGENSIGSQDTSQIMDNARQKDCSHLMTDVSCCRSQFSFLANALLLRRNVDRHVDLEMMANVKYMCAGSNSHIFTATWNDQPVILKTLQSAKTCCNLAVSELNIESELLTRIDHPNIIKILGSGVSPKPFIILERLQDVSQLFNFDRPQLLRRRPFTFLEVLQLAKNFADALKYLHNDMHLDAMIIHRDLKPENLGLTSDGELKLFDFGLCRCVKKRTEDHQIYEMTGNTGSLRYMAPEVVLGRPYNEKVDVYSFAVVMWAVATGCEPFSGFDVASHRSRVVMNGERPKMKKSWPDDFKDILNDCWQNESSRRPDFHEISNRISLSILKYNDSAPKRPMINSFLRNMSIPSFKSSR